MEKENFSIRVRSAPSPTGELHLGVARTALYNFLFAKKLGGQFILRIEDTDQARYVEGSMERFFADLKWLDLICDEGPDVGGEYGPYIQSERLELYQDAAKKLVSEGHAYHCYCTPERLDEMRKAQMAAKQPPHYDRHCLHLSDTEKDENKGKPSVVRFKIPEGTTTFTDLVYGDVTFQNATLDDLVLLKSDGFPTYHLAVIVDDHAMKISHVFRGEDWLPSTPKHVLLYQAFGWEAPAFVHLPNILAPSKQKLSKRRDGEKVWIATYRKQGYLPEALVNYLALLGWNPGSEQEFFTLEELVKEFSIERVHKAGAIFDPVKLKFFNAHYLRKLSSEEILSSIKKGSFLTEEVSKCTDEELIRWITISRDRMETLGEFSQLVAPLLTLTDYPKERLIFRKSDFERTQKALQSVQSAFEKASEITWQDQATLQELLAGLVTETDLTNGDVFWPVRVALSGLEASPSPTELLWALGKDVSLTRIKKAFDLLL